MRRRASLLFALLAVAILSSTARGIVTERVASGLSRPVFVTAPPGDTQHLYIVEQRSGTIGRIRLLDLGTGVLDPDPFLSISGLATGSEQGLLGLAFHPDYANNGKLYVNYTASGGAFGAGVTRVVEYMALSAEAADPTSARPILSFDQPFSNHNGGWLGFGPNDGYLYISSGDGGSGNDPQNNGQTLNTKLGKILRINVDGDDFPADANTNYASPPSNPFVGVAGDDAIWAYGLRNPWRDSFDRQTGDLWIGDVGQGTREEVDFQPASSSGGENYGWRVKEGTFVTGLGGGTGPFVDPVYEYDNESQGIAVTGGYVYRGADIPGLQGTYIFGDYGGPFFSGATVWSFEFDGSQISNFQERTGELTPTEGRLTQITSFGEDARGELYVMDLGGDVFKIAPDPPLLGDLDCDGDIDFDDVDAFVLGLNNSPLYETTYGVPPSVKGDLDGDGNFDFDDIAPFVNLLLAEPATSAIAASVPEPCTWILFAAGSLLLCRFAGRKK